MKLNAKLVNCFLKVIVIFVENAKVLVRELHKDKNHKFKREIMRMKENQCSCTSRNLAKTFIFSSF
ncbi:hypothetical protein PVIIG_06380 [Plasmodium vivax India VII]|uniref:Uncharacterized protein n=1 Tax=Plasmodium vivax India VII TaxID=1077284 RepID=A0A0J9S5T8_PLAVI|nr:hypothetical protein PVIIG_06380 [Plasmodium vivax India VII]